MEELIKQLEEYYNRLDKAQDAARDLVDRLEVEAANVSEAIEALNELTVKPRVEQEIEVPYLDLDDMPPPLNLTFNISEIDRKALELAFGGKF